jgi:hypothetical protein
MHRAFTLIPGDLISAVLLPIRQFVDPDPDPDPDPYSVGSTSFFRARIDIKCIMLVRIPTPDRVPSF